MVRFPWAAYRSPVRSSPETIVIVRLSCRLRDAGGDVPDNVRESRGDRERGPVIFYRLLPEITSVRLWPGAADVPDNRPLSGGCVPGPPWQSFLGLQTMNAHYGQCRFGSPATGEVRLQVSLRVIRLADELLVRHSRRLRLDQRRRLWRLGLLFHIDPPHDRGEPENPLR